jgi:hypothetical protein
VDAWAQVVIGAHVIASRSGKVRLTGARPHTRLHDNETQRRSCSIGRAVHCTRVFFYSPEFFLAAVLAFLLPANCAVHGRLVQVGELARASSRQHWCAAPYPGADPFPPATFESAHHALSPVAAASQQQHHACPPNRSHGTLSLLPLLECILTGGSISSTDWYAAHPRLPACPDCPSHHISFPPGSCHAPRIVLASATTPGPPSIHVSC